jgi:hypothetical protein
LPTASDNDDRAGDASAATHVVTERNFRLHPIFGILDPLIVEWILKQPLGVFENESPIGHAIRIPRTCVQLRMAGDHCDMAIDDGGQMRPQNSPDFAAQTQCLRIDLVQSETDAIGGRQGHCSFRAKNENACT